MYTKEELSKWLLSELRDLVKDIDTVKKSDMPEFNQGLDIHCAFGTKVERILDKLATPDLYEALKFFLEDYIKLVNSGDAGFWNPDVDPVVIKAREALSKAELL